jgi:hypothetical protein
VQESSTLFKQVDTQAMFAAVSCQRQDRLQPGNEAPLVAAQELGNTRWKAANGAPSGGPNAGEGVLALDIEEGGWGGVRGEIVGPQIECAATTASTNQLTHAVGCCTSDAQSDYSEYIQLQANIQRWVKARRKVAAQRRQPLTQQAFEQSVPEGIKLELQRLAALKHELAQAARAQTGCTVSATHHKPRLTRFLNAEAQRVSGQACTVSGPTNSEGGDDGCWVCFEGEPIPCQAWQLQRSHGPIPWQAWSL